MLNTENMTRQTQKNKKSEITFLFGEKWHLKFKKAIWALLENTTLLYLNKLNRKKYFLYNHLLKCDLKFILPDWVTYINMK